jgi:hypothetical protein
MKRGISLSLEIKTTLFENDIVTLKCLTKFQALRIVIKQFRGCRNSVAIKNLKITLAMVTLRFKYVPAYSIKHIFKLKRREFIL